jgi:hypothetical protein
LKLQLVLVFISNEFVTDPQCQRLFHYVKDTAKKNFVLIMVGAGREWRQSAIAAEVSDKASSCALKLSSWFFKAWLRSASSVSLASSAK